jgi:metal-responsive CopG/Arc/MetJ family transcriptional regulator
MATPQRPSTEETKHFIMRLPKMHRDLLDELAAKEPEHSRSAIIRIALEEYAARHGGNVSGAA